MATHGFRRRHSVMKDGIYFPNPRTLSMRCGLGKDRRGTVIWMQTAPGNRA